MNAIFGEFAKFMHMHQTLVDRHERLYHLNTRFFCCNND